MGMVQLSSTPIEQQFVVVITTTRKVTRNILGKSLHVDHALLL